VQKEYKYFPVVISAPSGGGKSTVKDFLIKRDSRFKFSVTCTTRPPRPKEREGLDYYFVSEKKFRELIKKGELIEWASVHGHLYGTPKKSVLSILKKGYIPIMTIDVNGAKSVKRIFNNAVSIFMLPPYPSVMIERLKKRGESVENLSVRLNTAKKEMSKSSFFDYLVVNDDIDKAVSSVISIVDAETMRVKRKISFIRDFSSKLSGIKMKEAK